MKNDHYTDLPLAGRVALVTGGGHRLGAAISRALAEAGADVVIHARAAIERAERLASELPGRALAVRADLVDPGAPVAILDQARAAGLEPDLLVHSAASFLRRPVLETGSREWDEVQALILRAFFLLGTEIARRRGSRGGDLIAIADSAALELWPSYVAHSVAKAGLLVLVRALAKALAPAFRVNAIVPGPVLPPEGTSERELEAMRERTLLRRLGRPDHVTEAVLFLLRCDYATGSVVEVTGGSQLWRGSARAGGAPESND